MAEPEDGGPEGSSPLTTRQDVVDWYWRHLGRAPEDEGAIVGRIGLPRTLAELEIYNSPEAAAHRAAEAAKRVEEGRREGERTPPAAQPPAAQPRVVDIPIIGGVADQIVNAIMRGIAPIVDRVNEIKDGLGKRLSETIGPLIREVQASGARITQGLADSLANAIPTMLQFAAEAADKAASVGEAFAAQAASLGDVADAFTGAISSNKDSIGSFIVERLGAAFGGGLLEAFHEMEVEGGVSFDAFADRILALDNAPAELRAAMQGVKDRSAPAWLLPVIAGVAALAMTFGGVLNANEIEKIRQQLNVANPANVIDPGTAAQAVARQWRSYDDMALAAKRHGFDEHQFRLLADLAFVPPTAGDVIAAGWRGTISPEDVDKWLNRSGYDAEARRILQEVAVQLPTVGDEIRYAVRDVYSEEIRARFGLLDAFPEEFARAVTKIGIPRDRAEKEWMAHWDIPSPQMLFEMLHREKITMEDVKSGLQAADVLPFFREPLIGIAYNPLGRIDIRRIHKMLKKDRAWLVQQNKYGGSSPENAEILADFTEALNAEESDEQKRNLSLSLVGRIIAAVVNGTLTNDEATGMLKRLGFADANIALFMTEAALVRNDSRTERLGELIGDLYVRGKRTKLETSEQLQLRGFMDTEIEHKFRAWDLEKELRAPSERDEKERDLTRADVESAYKDERMSKAEAQDMLKLMRYSKDEAALILGKVDYARKVLHDKQAQTVVRRLFLKGTITTVAAKQRLDGLGMRAEARDALVVEWEAERDTKSADLSVAQIGEAYKAAHVTDAYVKTYLARLGYDEDEIRILLLLWGSKIEEASKRTKLAQERVEAARLREARRVLAAAAVKERDLAKTDLLAAGKATVLTWGEVKTALLEKGYSVSEADVLIRTAQAAQVKKNA